MKMWILMMKTTSLQENWWIYSAKRMVYWKPCWNIETVVEINTKGTVYMIVLLLLVWEMIMVMNMYSQGH